MKREIGCAAIAKEVNILLLYVEGQSTIKRKCMFKKSVTILVLAFMMGISVISARPMVIKLGSAAPDNSIWADSLKELANEWYEISDGQIEVKIYFAGFKDEADLIRKMRFNQLQAGIVTGFGLQVLYPNVLALSVPFLIQSEDEFEYVLDEIGPVMAEEIEKKGFKLLTWAKAGWVYFYTKKPMISPSDMRQMKIASTGSEGGDLMNALKNLGFHPVKVGNEEVLPALASGMVEAVYATPLAVAAMQWFGVANNMADMKVAPFLGGILISDRVWQRIPEDIRPQLLESVERVGNQLDQQIGELEDDIIEQMKSHGLRVNDIPPEAVEEWKALFERGRQQSGDTLYSVEFMQRLEVLLQEYRSSN